MTRPGSKVDSFRAGWLSLMTVGLFFIVLVRRACAVFTPPAKPAPPFHDPGPRGHPNKVPLCHRARTRHCGRVEGRRIMALTSPQPNIHITVQGPFTMSAVALEAKMPFSFSRLSFLFLSSPISPLVSDPRSCILTTYM